MAWQPGKNLPQRKKPKAEVYDNLLAVVEKMVWTKCGILNMVYFIFIKPINDFLH